MMVHWQIIQEHIIVNISVSSVLASNFIQQSFTKIPRETIKSTITEIFNTSNKLKVK